MDNKKAVKLIYVSSDNNNKYYNMLDLENGYFKAEYGRVGATCQEIEYPISKWLSTYNSKIKKGYKDITSLFVEDEQKVVDFSDISDILIKQLITKLQAYAKKEVATFYNITADKVTQKQVDEAQAILNGLLTLTSLDTVNKQLIELYKVIPRRMHNVREHLLVQYEKDTVDKYIAKEQALLDTMAGQVKQSQLLKDNTNTDLTILDALGIDIFNVDVNEVNDIKKRLDNIAPQFMNAFRIKNRRTQKVFDSWITKASNKKRELFFHGSRNENWMSILETGLVLRPTNAVISGKMFGYGTYFADKAQKSLGYTSSRGSYWARGNSDEAYMALFDVHLGNMLHIKRHESWCGQLTEQNLKARGNYDSLFAEGGIDLRNNEFIVYNEAQSTVKYLIQLKG